MARRVPQCRYWETMKYCNDGDACRFRHGDDDRRTLKDSSIAAGSIDLPCRYWADGRGRCEKGQRCPFRHSKYTADEAVRRRNFAAAAPKAPLPPPVQSARGAVGRETKALQPLQQAKAAGTVGVSTAAAGAGAPPNDCASSSAAPTEVKWELPGEQNEVYFYGAAGAFPPDAAASAQAVDGVAAGKSWSAALGSDGKGDVSNSGGQNGARAGAAPLPKPAPVCVFFMQGNCRYGRLCRNSHVVPQQQPSGATNAAAAAAASANADAIDDDAVTDSEAEALLDLEEQAISATAECGICCDRVSGRFGLLDGCTCPFCLDCIRQWRRDGLEAQGAQTVRLCPLCRRPSHFITPSERLIVDPERREAAVAKYKRAMAAIPCRNYRYGDDKSCQFGTSCFYAHLRPDGRPVTPPRPRLRMGADGGPEPVQEVKLSSFF